VSWFFHGPGVNGKPEMFNRLPCEPRSDDSTGELALLSRYRFGPK
jgi:hypothetical protein